MLKATYLKHDLIFKEAGGTSRGVLHTKPSWFIKISNNKGEVGLGECSIIPGLSIESSFDLEHKIDEVCSNINEYVGHYHTTLVNYPSLRFAIEMALIDLNNPGPNLFDSDFTSGNDSIIINGLIWMGEADEMLQRIKDKLAQGFKCLKLKVGAIDFEKELGLLAHIRNHYPSDRLEIRLDANGAFSNTNAKDKLKALAQYEIHSIEQPIEAGQVNEMNDLCQTSPISIALDEELIGVNSLQSKKELLKAIQPQYIILKPSLVGGFKASEEWIEIAEMLNIKWWATSALESNIGLNAIAQWVYTKNNVLRQGLGTGQVFTNNWTSPLYLKGEKLFYNSNHNWESPFDIKI